MVGVPGRSKGCSTCRKRKKKCDLQRPTCGNCARGKFICGGYQRDMILVQVDPDGKGQYKPQHTADQPQATIREVSPADIRLRDLNRTAFEIECFNAFWGIYLPKDMVIYYLAKLKNEPTAVERWARWTHSVIPNSNIVRCALLAVSLLKVGKFRQDRAMMQRGMELYGKSLSQTSSQLKRPITAETIATCRLLAIYEQMNDTPASARNWLGHIHGLMQLIQSKPPEDYARPGDHELFLEMRYNAIVALLGARKSTFLSSPEWMTKPWNNWRKSVADTVNDVFIFIPEILEEFDFLAKLERSHEVLALASLLREKCWSLDAQLQQWLGGTTLCFNSFLGPEQAIDFSIDTDSTEDLPSRLIRHGLAPLFTMTLYWSACLTLYGSMQEIFTMFPPERSSETETLYSQRMDPTYYCVNIARSVPYFLHEATGLASAMGIAFPLGCLAQYLRHQMLTASASPAKQKLEEIEHALEEVSMTPTGAWITSFLSDLRCLRDQRMTQPLRTTTDELKSDDLSWHTFPYLYLNIVNHRYLDAIDNVLLPIGECGMQ